MTILHNRKHSIEPSVYMTSIQFNQAMNTRYSNEGNSFIKKKYNEGNENERGSGGGKSNHLFHGAFQSCSRRRRSGRG